MLPVEVTAHEDTETGATAAAALLVDLQGEAAEGHGVVPTDDTRFFVVEDLIEVGVDQRDERGGRIRGQPRELAS